MIENKILWLDDLVNYMKEKIENIVIFLILCLYLCLRLFLKIVFCDVN